MFKNILFSLMAIVALVGNEAQCGKDGESSNSTSDEAKKSAPKVNPWVKPYLPKRVENQRDAVPEGGLRHVKIDYLADNPNTLEADKEAYRLSGEGHRSSVFERCVRNAQVAFLKDYVVRRDEFGDGRTVYTHINLNNLKPLAEHIDVFRKYKHWGQDAVDVTSVLDAYYHWACLPWDNSNPDYESKKKGPFADNSLPFYRKSIAGIPGKHLFERDMAFFMSVIQDDVRSCLLNVGGGGCVQAFTNSYSDCFSRLPLTPRIFAPHFYYDEPEANKEAGAVERFMRSQIVLTCRKRIPSSDPLDVQREPLTIKDYRELSKMEVLFDFQVWWSFTGNLIAGKFHHADEYVTKILGKTYAVQVVDVHAVNRRMMACYQWLFDKMLEEESRRGLYNPERWIPLLMRSQAWASKIVQYYGSRVTARCDIDGEHWTEDDTQCLVYYEGGPCHITIPDDTQRLFWRLENGVSKVNKILKDNGVAIDSETQTLCFPVTFHPYVLPKPIQTFMDTYHIREAVEKRILAPRPLTSDAKILMLNKMLGVVPFFKSIEDQLKAAVGFMLDNASIMFEMNADAPFLTNPTPRDEAAFRQVLAEMQNDPTQFSVPVGARNIQDVILIFIRQIQDAAETEADVHEALRRGPIPAAITNNNDDSDA